MLKRGVEEVSTGGALAMLSVAAGMALWRCPLVASTLKRGVEGASVGRGHEQRCDREAHGGSGVGCPFETRYERRVTRRAHWFDFTFCLPSKCLVPHAVAPQ